MPRTPRADAIVVNHARKHFGHHLAVDNIDFRVTAGERVALLGASGSGKSTLIRLLSGLERSDRDSGGIEILGRSMQAHGEIQPEARELRRDVGVIFQQFNLVGRLPVLTNVLLGLSSRVPLWRLATGNFSADEQAQALQALAQLGLTEQAFQRASTLSGGQQQRAAIARVLLQGAQVVLADEPVASLDPESTKRVMDHLVELNARLGITLVVSLHQVHLARRYCHRVIALKRGRVLFDGPSQYLDGELIRDLYGQGAQELLSADAVDLNSPPSHLHSTHPAVT